MVAWRRGGDGGVFMGVIVAWWCGGRLWCGGGVAGDRGVQFPMLASVCHGDTN